MSDIRIEERVDIGEGQSTIINMNDSIPDNEESSQMIDMRFNALPDNSVRSSMVASEDYDSELNGRSRPRNESPNTKEYRYAIHSLRD